MKSRKLSRNGELEPNMLPRRLLFRKKILLTMLVVPMLIVVLQRQTSQISIFTTTRVFEIEKAIGSTRRRERWQLVIIMRVFVSKDGNVRCSKKAVIRKDNVRR